MATARLTVVTFRDAKGNTATMRFRVTGATPAALSTAATAVTSTLAALTNAHIQQINGATSTDPTEVIYGTNAEYASVEDKAVFTFQTASGAIHRFQIPAPLAALFLADGETVDQTNTAVVAFTSAITANAVDSAGGGITFGGVGIRQRRKLRRRANIFTKAPDLAIPEE